jgi:hypothetical protein
MTEDFDPLANFRDIEEPSQLDHLSEDDASRVLAIAEALVLSVHEARHVTLSSDLRMEREPLLEGLEEIRDRLPEELKTARWMIRERVSFIARTNEEATAIRHKAQQVLASAQETAKDLVSDHSILAEAVEEANALIRNAEVEAQGIRLMAEDLSLEQLGRLDTMLSSMLRETRTVSNELGKSRATPPPVQGV